jgi:hypothetical protein
MIMYLNTRCIAIYLKLHPLKYGDFNSYILLFGCLRYFHADESRMIDRNGEADNVFDRNRGLQNGHSCPDTIRPTSATFEDHGGVFTRNLTPLQVV